MGAGRWGWNGASPILPDAPDPLVVHIGPIGSFAIGTVLHRSRDVGRCSTMMVMTKGGPGAPPALPSRNVSP